MVSSQERQSVARKVAAITPEARQHDKDPYFPPLATPDAIRKLDFREITPQLNTDFVLARLLGPWRMLFDFRHFDPSDLIEYEITIATAPGQWQSWETHRIGFSFEPLDGSPALYMSFDGSLVGRGKLWMIEAPDIKLPMALHYRHLRSSQRLLRYAMVP